MRRCPVCQRTYDDNMKFCQTDGTMLIEDNSASEDGDPFKTVLAEPKADKAHESDFDPMKTMLATPPQVDLPPPSPFGEPELKSSGGASHNPPALNNDLGAPQFNNAPLPSEQYSGGFGQTSSEPFNQPQSGGFDNAPRTPTFQEPEQPQFGAQPNFGQQPFGQPNEWTPPSVPQTGWDNQGLGQNTPFNPSPSNASANSGLPKILGIVSLVLGIISFPAMCLCYANFVTAPIGIITGGISYFMSRNDPQAGSSKWFGVGGAAASLLSLVLVIVLLIIWGGMRAISR